MKFDVINVGIKNKTTSSYSFDIDTISMFECMRSGLCSHLHLNFALDRLLGQKLFFSISFEIESLGTQIKNLVFFFNCNGTMFFKIKQKLTGLRLKDYNYFSIEIWL